MSPIRTCVRPSIRPVLKLNSSHIYWDGMHHAAKMKCSCSMLFLLHFTLKFITASLDQSLGMALALKLLLSSYLPLHLDTHCNTSIAFMRNKFYNCDPWAIEIGWLFLCYCEKYQYQKKTQKESPSTLGLFVTIKEIYNKLTRGKR